MIFFYKISSSLFVNRNDPAAIPNFGPGSRRQFNFVSSAPAPLPFYNTKICRDKCVDVLVIVYPVLVVSGLPAGPRILT
jgi:hypothetical protein